jgi:hypothetical protein
VEPEWTADDYCPSCGWRQPRATYGCFCVAVFGSAQDRAELIEAAVGGDSVACRQVGFIRDGDSRSALEHVVRSGPSDGVVASAASALANIADAASLPVMVELAKVAWGDRLPHTVRYFWRLGTPGAVEALAAMLEAWPVQVAMPLAKLGDERGVRALIELLRPMSNPFDRRYVAVIADFAPGPWTADLLDAFNESADLEAIVERAVDNGLLGLLHLRARQEGLPRPASLDDWEGDDFRVTEADWIESTRTRERTTRLHDLASLAHVVVHHCGEDGANAVRNASERWGVDLLHLVDRNYGEAAVDVTGPTVRAWALDYELGDPHHPGTRFGGQPTWIDSPTWPLTAAGTPMAFWAQVRFPDDPDRMAYLFVDNTDDIIQTDMGTASMFVQPGGQPSVPWAARNTGPVLPDKVQRDRSAGAPQPWSLAARVPSLRAFDDPVEDRQVVEQSWDKVGGHGVFLQWDPAPEGFEFFGQFTAESAGHELADGAQCYLYVNRDNGDGLFLWDCH